jgi:phosphatidylethanolamine/phosphatidyl-N-methylethanolamine N-methyltransferase
MSLKHSYTLIAPLYDAVVERASREPRLQSLRRLPADPRTRVLVNGIGTGLDLPHLPPGPAYFATDLTAAMLGRARRRNPGIAIRFVQADSLALPFPDAFFDHAILHLILAVVPDPGRCLGETARVLKAGGSVLILDKFLRPGQYAPLRRALNLVSRHVATRLDVVFEDVLRGCPELRLDSDQPAFAGGWFRSIRLVKA